MLKRGFKSYVQVYDETYYVDTFSGEGLDKVLKKMDPLISKYASTTYIPSYSFEDVKHEITILTLEGIQYFEPNRGVKLSTFLQTHLHNKIISKIKSENKMSNDAFNYFDKTDPANKKNKRARKELHFSQFIKPGEPDEPGFENSIPDDGGLYSTPCSDYDLVDFETSLLKISSKLDLKTRKIIELVYFEDYSIKDAAATVGLSGWAASMRLKKLAMRGTFKTIFEQQLIQTLLKESELEASPELK